MKKILIIIAVIGGFYYLQPQLFTGLLKGKGAFDAQGNAQIIVFSYDGCGRYCDDAIAMIKKTKQDFEHIIVSPNSAGEETMKSYGLSTRNFPGIIVGNEKFNGFYPHKLKPVLVDHFGTSVLSGPERRIMKTHFNKDGSPKFIFYGTSWCGYCKKLRNYLTENNVTFTELDVEKDSKAMGYFKALGGKGYPFAFIGHTQVDGGNLSAVAKDIGKLM